MIKNLKTAILSLGLVSMASSAQAYSIQYINSHPVRWTIPYIYFELYGEGYGQAEDVEAGTLYHSTKAARVSWSVTAGFWSGNVNAPFGTQFNINNGHPQIGYSTSPLIMGGAMTRTFLVVNPYGSIEEADIYVDSYVNWTTSNIKSEIAPYAATGAIPLNGPMIREFGHAIGLLDEPGLYNIMGDSQNYFVGSDDHYMAYVGADGGKGLQAIHGTNLLEGEEPGYTPETGFPGAYSKDDLLVSHFVYDEGSTEDSPRHRRGFVLAPNLESVRTVSKSDNEPVYSVWPGARVQFEVSTEKVGASAGHANMEVYLASGPNLFSDSPILINSRPSPPHESGEVRTRRVRAVIPGDTVPGDYYLFARIVPTTPDDSDSNNISGVQIKVVPLTGDCSPTTPCGQNAGDCNYDSDCQTGMICTQNVGTSFGAPWWVDICQYPQGNLNFCSKDMPCGPGKGDCDSGSECLSGICEYNVGADYGFPFYIDVCE